MYRYRTRLDIRTGDSLGARTIPCDVTSPWAAERVLAGDFETSVTAYVAAFHPPRHWRSSRLC